MSTQIIEFDDNEIIVNQEESNKLYSTKHKEKRFESEF